jgi:hypothetical protein
MPENTVPQIRRSHFPDRLLLVPIHIRDERLAICKPCPNNKDSHCSTNAKPIYATATKRNGACPMGFWSTYYGS